MLQDEMSEKAYHSALAEQKAQQQNQDATQAPGAGVYGSIGRAKTREERISDIFTYHNDPSKVPNYNAIRSTAKHFADVIMSNSPAGQDQALALLYLRQAVMFANAAIALEGRTL
jgi:hypothetical protein